MATLSMTPPASIPKSVFYGLVKELVGDEVESRDEDAQFPNRVSATAVALLQRTTEDYIANIFTKTGTPENKILTVDSFQAARGRHDQDEHKEHLGLGETDRTILDYDESTDELME